MLSFLPQRVRDALPSARGATSAETAMITASLPREWRIAFVDERRAATAAAAALLPVYQSNGDLGVRLRDSCCSGGRLDSSPSTALLALPIWRFARGLLSCCRISSPDYSQELPGIPLSLLHTPATPCEVSQENTTLKRLSEARQQLPESVERSTSSLPALLVSSRLTPVSSLCFLKGSRESHPL